MSLFYTISKTKAYNVANVLAIQCGTKMARIKCDGKD